MYEYECAYHGRFRSDHRGDTEKCPVVIAFGFLCKANARRVWGFSYKPMIHSHYNTATNSVVSSNAQLKSELARASEAASTPHVVIDDVGESHVIQKPATNFVPVDWRDKEALGVTNLGLDSTYDRMKAQGRDSDAAKLKRLMDD